MLNAVFAAKGLDQDDDLVALLARTDAVASLLQTPDGANLLTAYRRAANILRIEERKDGPHTDAADPDLLPGTAEIDLDHALAACRCRSRSCCDEEAYGPAMTHDGRSARAAGCVLRKGDRERHRSRICAAIVCVCSIRSGPSWIRSPIFPVSKARMRSAMTKWVYSFGAGHNEGRADMRNLLGGKGANLAEMASIGLPVPPGFTITTEVCTAFYDNNRKYPDDLKAQVDAALARDRKGRRPELRRPGASAAGVGALRRARLDARHDGHRAEPRPERHDRRGPGQGRQRSTASPGTPTAASSRCTARSCWASTTTGSRKSSSTPSWTPT